MIEKGVDWVQFTASNSRLRKGLREVLSEVALNYSENADRGEVESSVLTRLARKNTYKNLMDYPRRS
jgi:hypothetical protein